MHPKTNSSNGLVKSFFHPTYTSLRVVKAEKSCLWIFAPSAPSVCVVTGKGVQSRAGMGESSGEAQLCGLSPGADPHVHRALLSPLLCPGACSSCTCNQRLGNLYRANTKLTFVSCWNVFEEEKTPACLPGCLFPTLYSKPLCCCATKGESERAGNKNLLDGKSE